MKHGQEDGYILASILAVLIAISLVAAALLSTSADGLMDVKEAEAETKVEVKLRSAVLVVSTQLALDPRRRQLDLDQAEPMVSIFDQAVSVRTGWEGSKLDVNLASPEAIGRRLAEAGVDQIVGGKIQAAVQRSREDEKPISLLDSILPAAADAYCLHSILTVFGGRPDYDAGDPAPPRIGRPAAGARVAVEVWLKDAPRYQGLEAVLLMTGDPARPAEVLDWRRVRAGGKERCNVQAAI
jgi:hypothetical protein